MLAPLLLALAAPSPPPLDVAALCARFTGYDQDGDGELELARVAPLLAAGDEGPRVLILAEARLVATQAGELDLVPDLARWAEDLAADGWRAEVLSVELAPSARHKDGRYVLALRELLRAFAAEGPLDGALLFGHFPDATLVRTCNWRKREDVALRRGAPDEARYADAPWLRRVPEVVAQRCDLVLADLDGRWEELYVEPRTRLASVSAVFAGEIPAAGGACVDLELGGVTCEDVFLVSDGKCEVRETLGADGAPAGWAVLLDDRAGDHEASAADRERPNVLARPDVLVSRVDARGTALRPRADVVGSDGGGLLDASGAPRAVEFASADAVPHWRDGLWELDPALERRLLHEFLARDHAFRTGAAGTPRRATSLACGLGSGLDEMRRAAEAWDAADARLADLAGAPSLVDVADWLAYPALLRTLRAHSDPWGSAFAKTDAAALDARLAGHVWSWTPRGARLEPSLAAACGGGKLDWFLLRSLYEAGAVAAEPCFWHHTGCEAISPPGWERRAYDDPRYGERQGAEALLFYAGGLALVGRAKVFYDEPRGFAEALREGATFGAAWARYHEHESRAESWGRVGGDIGRKRSYFWSVLGDWTLRLEPRG